MDEKLCDERFGGRGAVQWSVVGRFSVCCLSPDNTCRFDVFCFFDSMDEKLCDERFGGSGVVQWPAVRRELSEFWQSLSFC